MNIKVHYKEKLYFIIMTVFSIFTYAVVLLNAKAVLQNRTAVIYICIAIALVVLSFLGSFLLVSALKGNAIKVTARQFPEIFAILEAHSQKLGLKKTPDTYLLQAGGMLNAFATKFARKNYVVLYSSILEIAYQEGIDAVSFIIGHELGHIQRNHTSFLKYLLILPANFIPFLSSAYSRAREYTCDNIGYNLCPQGALKGILVLAAGKQLYKKVNIQELLENTKHESKFVISFAEIFSTHPVLVKRIATIHKLNLENIVPESPLFFGSKIDRKQTEANQ